jgi:2'-5' RNA ligase
VIIDHFVDNSYVPIGVSRVDWNFNVLLTDISQIRKMLASFAEPLTDSAFYDPIPAVWAHITILRVNLEWEICEQDMKAVCNKLKTALSSQAPIVCRFGQHRFDGGTVILDIEPRLKLMDIFDLVMETCVDVLGHDRVAPPRAPFNPHLSLVYGRTQEITDQKIIIDRLREKNIQLPTFTVDSMSLIKQWPIDGHYEWKVIEEVTFK